MRSQSGMRRITMLVLVAALGMMLLGCSLNVSKNESEEEKGDTAAPVAGTTWIASDGSELIFDEEGNFAWYREEGNHEGDYLSGYYEFYKGEEAVEFTLNDLEEYGITEEEIDRLMGSGDAPYEKEDYVVYLLYHEEAKVDGEMITIDYPDIYYYGFLSEEDTVMDTVNMRTASTYHFEKK